MIRKPTGRPRAAAGRLSDVEDLKRRLSLAPANADLRLLLAHKLAACSLWDEAVHELDIVIRRDANNLHARKFREQLLAQASQQAS